MAIVELQFGVICDSFCPFFAEHLPYQGRRKSLMAASRTRDTIATARCELRCVASLVFVRLVKAGDVELNPGPRDKRGESGLHVVEV